MHVFLYSMQSLNIAVILRHLLDHALGAYSGGSNIPNFYCVDIQLGIERNILGNTLILHTVCGGFLPRDR